MHVLTSIEGQNATASSAVRFNKMARPPRMPSLAVNKTFALALLILSRKASALKPANTTLARSKINSTFSCRFCFLNEIMPLY